MSNPVFNENRFNSNYSNNGYNQTTYNQNTNYNTNYDTVSNQRNVMTVNGSIGKTFILGIVFAVASYLSYLYFFKDGYADFAKMSTVSIISVIAAFIVALIISFKPKTAPSLAVVYAALESIAITAISIGYAAQYAGIVLQAILGTLIVLFVMLALFRARIIRATETFKSVVAIATISIAIFYLAMFVLSFFNITPDFFYGSGTVSLLISGAIIIIAALNLILDFDFIEKGSAAGYPKYMEWYAAFGLMVTIVWLYIEILRILAKFRNKE